MQCNSRQCAGAAPGRNLLYVEPIYLQSETAAYPELRLVILMHNDTLAYGKSLDEALGKLYGDQEETQSFVATGDTGERAARELARLKEIFSTLP